MMGLCMPELVVPDAMLDRDGLRDVAIAWAELAAVDLDWEDRPTWDDREIADAVPAPAPAPRGRN